MLKCNLNISNLEFSTLLQNSTAANFVDTFQSLVDTIHPFKI